MGGAAAQAGTDEGDVIWRSPPNAQSRDWLECAKDADVFPLNTVARCLPVLVRAPLRRQYSLGIWLET